MLASSSNSNSEGKHELATSTANNTHNDNDVKHVSDVGDVLYEEVMHVVLSENKASRYAYRARVRALQAAAIAHPRKTEQLLQQTMATITAAAAAAAATAANKNSSCSNSSSSSSSSVTGANANSSCSTCGTVTGVVSVLRCLAELEELRVSTHTTSSVSVFMRVNKAALVRSLWREYAAATIATTATAGGTAGSVVTGVGHVDVHVKRLLPLLCEVLLQFSVYDVQLWEHVLKRMLSLGMLRVVMIVMSQLCQTLWVQRTPMRNSHILQQTWEKVLLQTVSQLCVRGNEYRSSGWGCAIARTQALRDVVILSHSCPFACVGTAITASTATATTATSAAVAVASALETLLTASDGNDCVAHLRTRLCPTTNSAHHEQQQRQEEEEQQQQQQQPAATPTSPTTTTATATACDDDGSSNAVMRDVTNVNERGAASHKTSAKHPSAAESVLLE